MLTKYMLALLIASSSPRFEEVALASVLAMRKKSASPIASLAAATCKTTTLQNGLASVTTSPVCLQLFQITLQG